MAGNCEKSVTADVEKVEGETSAGNSVQPPTESSPAKSAEAESERALQGDELIVVYAYHEVGNSYLKVGTNSFCC
ncbi:hypothetical protein DMENIID0001_059520 [Sergentomyia squamirostris]